LFIVSSFYIDTGIKANLKNIKELAAYKKEHPFIETYNNYLSIILGIIVLFSFILILIGIYLFVSEKWL
jgi:hypothetical protein